MFSIDICGIHYDSDIMYKTTLIQYAYGSGVDCPKKVRALMMCKINDMFLDKYLNFPIRTFSFPYFTLIIRLSPIERFRRGSGIEFFIIHSDGFISDRVERRNDANRVIVSLRRDFLQINLSDSLKANYQPGGGTVSAIV